jgi:diguanylate cyclase (GGDEF)-like protein/PAS domain S-box-containing protein
VVSAATDARFGQHVDSHPSHRAGARDAAPAPDPAALYRALLEGHPEPTFSVDVAGRLVACNRAFAHFVGRPAEAAAGSALTDLVLPAQRATAERAWAAALTGRPQSFQAEFEGPDHTVSVGYVTLAPVTVDGRVAGAQGIARDVTVYQVMEEQLHARVFTDPLTGLANRDQLLEAVARACRRAEPPSRAAVLFLDLDDFKLANDALGHASGDRLLAAVGDRLRAATRGGDVVARLGGDEFAVLLDGLVAPEDVTVVVGRVQGALAEPVTLDGRSVRVAASMGVAHWDGAATPAELVRNADLAMYRAKRLGKNRHVLYDVRMHAEARERLDLASDLRAALAGEPGAGQVTAAFQPIVDLATGRVVKAEALARWAHPARGNVPPGVFIPVAEDTGLVDALGAHMLRLGCAQLRRWQDAAAAAGAGPSLGVTVNVSGRSLDGGAVRPAVREALAESGAEPSGLTIELTESVAMRDPGRVLDTLTALAAMGVGAALDDFGTGYSSLAYLHRYPLRVLKIDKSFVDGLDGASPDPHSEALVRTVVQLARALGLQTVAEGVETEAQRDALRGLGCDLGQGYLFGRPARLGARLRLGQQVEAERAVRAPLGHPVERGARGGWRGGERRVVLDVAERALPGQRHLHARVEHARRVERALHRREQRQRLRAPHAAQQRGAEPPVPVLAGERAAQRGREPGHVVQQPLHGRAPVGAPHVHERVDVHVRVARVAEDHAAHPAPGERRAHAPHVVGQAARRHAPVLDELHARQRRVQPREDGAGGVAQLPERVLGGRVERERHVAGARRAERVAQRAGRGARRGRVAGLHLAQQHGLGHRAALGAHRVGQRAALRGHVQEGAVEQLARGRARRPRALGA